MDRIGNKKSSQRLPADLYIGLVNALFQDRNSLIMGSAATTLAAIVVAIHTSGWWAWGFAFALPLVAAWRVRDFSVHNRAVAWQTAITASYWEKRYLLGTSIFLNLLGTWTCATYYLSNNEFVHTMALITTVSHALGIATRNFTVGNGSRTQLLAVGIPVVLAFVFAGGAYPLLIPLILVPLGFFIAGSAARLRNTFLQEMLEHRRAMQIAQRFDASINNMPHGLCMINSDGKVAVSNEALKQMLGGFENYVSVGALANDLIAALVRQNILVAADGARLCDAILKKNDSRTHLSLNNTKGNTFEVTIQRMENDGAVLVVQDFTERRNAQRAIERLAKFDPTTGLPNRSQFEQRLSELLLLSKGSAQRVSVLFIDLDDFKLVNDTLGHAAGDDVLRTVASRMRNFASSADLIARWGGDEFALLKFDDTLEIELCDMAAQLIHALSAPYEVDGMTAVVGASIGIAIAANAKEDAASILKHADLALYAAKGAGRNNLRVFQSEMDHRAQLRRVLELDVREAVENSAFEVFFQPLLSINSDQIISFEALARWRHPTRGFVPPTEFIPFVENLGLIEPFTNHVLRQACLACADWPNDIRIAVNLSALYFQCCDVLENVESALLYSGLAPERLELEITENLVLDNRPSTIAALNILRARGIRIALDDFGTGFSSFSYLLDLPVDKVKIDRSFVAGLVNDDRARSLVDSLARLIGRLGMHVTLEGVETMEQYEKVKGFGSIDEVQGYLFSKPVEQDQVATLLLRSAERSLVPNVLNFKKPSLARA